MIDVDKVCLKWNRYESNIRQYFKKLRDDQRLCDVTIATEDGEYIQAHKIALCAGSNFFSDIFMKNNHSNMLVYLKGISSSMLQPVLDFMYNGETCIGQDEVNMFIEAGKELHIKGLDSEVKGNYESVSEKLLYPKEGDNQEEKVTPGSEEDITESVSEKRFYPQVTDIQEVKVTPDLEEDYKDTLVDIDENLLPLIRTNDELSLQINDMVEKNEDNMWRCKVCGKTATHKGNLKQHAEIHLEGMAHECHICNKTFSSRVNLRYHVTNNHTKLLSCDICEPQISLKAMKP